MPVLRRAGFLYNHISLCEVLNVEVLQWQITLCELDTSSSIVTKQWFYESASEMYSLVINNDTQRRD